MNSFYHGTSAENIDIQSAVKLWNSPLPPRRLFLRLILYYNCLTPDSRLLQYYCRSKKGGLGNISELLEITGSPSRTPPGRLGASSLLL